MSRSSSDERRARTRVAVLAALGVLFVLNLADVLVTRQALAKGLTEANPVGKLLLGGTWPVFAVKCGVPLVAAALAYRRRATVAYVSAVWAVAGFYGCIVTLNTVAVLSA